MASSARSGNNNNINSDTNSINFSSSTINETNNVQQQLNQSIPQNMEHQSTIKSNGTINMMPGSLSNAVPRSISGNSLNTRIQYPSESNQKGSTKRNVPRTRKEEFLFYYNKLMRGISHSINIIKAVIMRIVFSLHSLVAIMFVYMIKQDEWYLVNIIGVIFLCMEVFVTVIKRKGREPRW
jgi:hypothetical protein